MNDICISVILPKISDGGKLKNFLSNIFACGIGIDVSVCGKVDLQGVSSLGEDILSRVKIYPSQNHCAALQKAIAESEGRYILFSDTDITYSQQALARMAEYGACVFNGSGDNGMLFSENFGFDEAADKSAYYCCLLGGEIVRKNGILPVSNTGFSLMNMIADYARYNELGELHEGLFYIANMPENNVDAKDIENLENYSWLFSQTANDKVKLFFIRNVMCYFSSCEQKQTYEMLRGVLLPFMGDYSVCAWFKAVYGWDAEILKSNASVQDFKRLGTQVNYREVEMPVEMKPIIQGFYMGRFGVGDLKKCIAAYAYFKAYRMKAGFLRDKLCALAKRMLGGDFDA